MARENFRTSLNQCRGKFRLKLLWVLDFMRNRSRALDANRSATASAWSSGGCWLECLFKILGSDIALVTGLNSEYIGCVVSTLCW